MTNNNIPVVGSKYLSTSYYTAPVKRPGTDCGLRGHGFVVFVGSEREMGSGQVTPDRGLEKSIPANSARVIFGETPGRAAELRPWRLNYNR